MSFTVTIAINRSFHTKAPAEKVFELLADVEKSGSFFPKVEKMVNLGDNTWRWEMERIGIGEHTLQQTIYACRYHSDKNSLNVTWTPVEGIGNGIVEGKWEIVPMEGEARIIFHSGGVLTVGLPAFLDFLLSPLIRLEFERLVDEYITNLTNALEHNQTE